MTITPIMQYIQDRILEAVHGCTLEEAIEIDLNNTLNGGCIYIKETKLWFHNVLPEPYTIDPYEHLKAPSLARVLTALGSKNFFRDYYIGYNGNLCFHLHNEKFLKGSFSWKLLNEDGTECNLFDQSQDTITAIGLLLGWKDEKTL